MDKLNSFINKIIKTNDGIKGLCIGTLAKTNELVIQTGKGGQIFYEKVENCNETQ